jgi:hypothetical protein
VQLYWIWVTYGVTLEKPAHAFIPAAQALS